MSDKEDITKRGIDYLWGDDRWEGEEINSFSNRGNHRGKFTDIKNKNKTHGILKKLKVSQVTRGETRSQVTLSLGGCGEQFGFLILSIRKCGGFLEGSDIILYNLIFQRFRS